MRIEERTYTSFEDDNYVYKVYVCENEADFKEFKRLFIEEKFLENKRLDKGSADKWLQSTCRLFGFYKSYPELFDGVSANNDEHPFQFYNIDLKETPFNSLIKTKVEVRNEIPYMIRAFLGNPYSLI